LTWLEVVTLGALALWNQATYVLVEMAARPGLTPIQALTITQTSTAIANTLPGGAAIGAGLQSAMYVTYGFRPADIAISMAVTGTWNTFVKLGMPLVALLLLALGGAAGGPLVAAALLGVGILGAAVVVFALILRSERGALAMGHRLTPLINLMARLARKAPREDWADATAGFRRRTVALLRARWAHVTIATIVSHLTLFFVLLLSLRHLGVSNAEVPWEEVLAAFAFVRLLSAIPITPGGLGVVELGLVAALAAAGGDEASVVAAVLIFRLVTFVLPIPFGVGMYFLWRHEATRVSRAGA
jgi:uncharacterized protein (TIRG00374 family)